MNNRLNLFILIPAMLIVLVFSGCTKNGQSKTEPVPLEVPPGYMDILEIDTGNRILRFGPFVGYYFRPKNPDDVTRLDFICFNERNFYTLDVPENARLFEGDARFVRLPETGFTIPDKSRINPVLFDEAPDAWKNARPEPMDEYLHFHSCYDATGAVLSGYWLRHTAKTDFTYDMGNRVKKPSPLYHTVTKGVDKQFARIMEFDQGPNN